jgi:hypothetical protein
MDLCHNLIDVIDLYIITTIHDRRYEQALGEIQSDGGGG